MEADPLFYPVCVAAEDLIAALDTERHLAEVQSAVDNAGALFALWLEARKAVEVAEVRYDRAVVQYRDQLARHAAKPVADAGSIARTGPLPVHLAL